MDRAWLLGAWLVLPACGLNADGFGGGTTEQEVSTGDAEGTSTSASASASTSSASASGSATGSTGEGSSSDASDDVMTTAVDGTTMASDESTDEGTTGGEPVNYPNCGPGGRCPEDFPICETYDEDGMIVSYCSQSCEEDRDCPDPSDGNAEPYCFDSGFGDTCYLDCGFGRDCPTGMVCFPAGPTGYCAFPE